MLRVLLFCTAIFSIWTIAAANQPDQIRFKHWSVEDGLSSNSVICVQQDPQGFMWFGTLDGLNRFDGYEFQVFKHNPKDSLSLSSNRINTIFLDSRNNLWIGTGNGLNLFHAQTETFQAFFPSSPPQNSSNLYVKSIIEDQEGKLLIGTSEGLLQFDVRQQKFIVQDQSSETPYRMGDDNILAIVPDQQGFFWLGTTQTLKIFKDGKILPASTFHQDKNVFDPLLHTRTIMQDSNGIYWFGTELQEEFLFRFDQDLKLLPPLSENKSEGPNDKIRVIRELSGGYIGIGALNGFFLYDKKRQQFNHYVRNKQNPHTLSHNSVRDIYEDKNGGIWLATYRGGINYFHPSNQLFQLLQEEPWSENSLSHDVITSLVEDHRNNLWIGSEYGLNYYDAKQDKYVHYYQDNSRNGLLDNIIKSLALDRKGNLWIGTLNGLSLFDPQTQQFTSFIHIPDDSTSIAYGHVHKVLIDTDQQIWVGTNGGGLNLYLPQEKRFKKFFPQPANPGSLVDDQVNTLVQGEDMIWIGSPRGLDVINRKNHQFPLEYIPDTAQLLRNNIIALHYNPAGILWIGTENHGLVYYHIKSREVFAINTSNGLLGNTIKAILEDDQGNLWISGNQGISKVIKPEGPWRPQEQYQTIHFSSGDGLQGLQYYPGSALKGKQGTFYFGGSKGLNSFLPQDIPDKLHTPKVVFTSLKIRNSNTYPFTLQQIVPTRLANDTDIALAHQQSDFSISFSALDFTAPQEVAYAYKLEPIDQDWNVLGDQRTVNFKQLPAGSYTFKVRASNDLRRWAEDSSILKFEILPPWWKSSAAIIGYILLAILLLITFFILATRWERLKTELQIGQLEREKEHELHQQRLRFFTNLSHELRTPLTLILAPLSQLVRQSQPNLRIKNQLNMIQRNGERMLNLINQILDIRKTETGNAKLKAAEGNIVKFLREVTLAFREIALIQKVDFYFNAGEDVMNVYFDRDKLEVVMYNLLSNAFKFTPPGGQISVIVSRVQMSDTRQGPQLGDQHPEDWVEIIVQDNGRGIPKAIQQKIFQRFFSTQNNEVSGSTEPGTGIGLELAKKYISLHRGNIDVISIPTKDDVPGYTRFSFRLPFGASHLEESEIIPAFKNSEDINLYEKNWFLDQQQPNEQTLHPPTPVINIESLPQQSMLIVEDNQEVRQYLCDFFRREFQIYEATDGQHGIDLASEVVPDIIISDIMMPGIDGMELCRTLKSDIRTSHIPVILLTARTAISFRFEGLETGADDYITKPFNSEHLQLRVRNLIQQRQWIRRHFNSEQKLLPEHITLTSVDERLLRETINYIRENISESELTVERLSRKVGLSRVHFYRKIKALTDLSPVEFIRNIRLECAAELLETGHFNISEVRYRIGIHNADYFRKCFKEKYGVTPSDYIRQKASSKPG